MAPSADQRIDTIHIAVPPSTKSRALCLSAGRKKNETIKARRTNDHKNLTGPPDGVICAGRINDSSRGRKNSVVNVTTNANTGPTHREPRRRSAKYMIAPTSAKARD